MMENHASMTTVLQLRFKLSLDIAKIARQDMCQMQLRESAEKVLNTLILILSTHLILIQ